METAVNSKADAWRRRIEEQRTSGQSVRAWCQANGAHEHSFYWWRARLGLVAGNRRHRRSSKPRNTGPLSFAKVNIIRPPVAEPLRLRLPGERELVLPASMPLEQVANLLRLVEVKA